MAFPSIASSVTSVQDTDAGTQVVTLPGSIVAGDVLVVVIGIDGTVSTQTWPAGWTQLFTPTASGNKLEARFRVADGSEGASISITCSVNERSAARAYRITGGSGLVEGAVVSGNSAAPNPPSLNPAGWGTDDTLWLAAEICNPAVLITAFPASYGNTGDVASAGAGVGVRLGTCNRDLNAASEDPGAFTNDTSAPWVACTIGVQPGGVTVALGLAAETDAALAMSWTKTVTFGQALETDAGLSASLAKALALGLATESDAAQPLTVGKAVTFGQAAEIDSALAVAISKAVELGQAVEVDSPLALTIAKALSFGQAVEIDEALSLTFVVGDTRNWVWAAGRPQAKWRAGTPRGKWSTGEPEPKWQARSPRAKWSAGEPAPKWRVGAPRS